MSERRSFLGRIGGGIWRLCSWVIKSLIKGAVLFFLVLFIFGIVAGSRGIQNIQVPESGALRVEINGQIVDQLTYIDPYTALTGSNQVQELLLSDLVGAFEFARKDERINSAVLVLHDMQGTSISKIEELGSAIEDFKAAGKRVVAVSDYYSQSQYMLASFADEIFMHPLGRVQLSGLSSSQFYLADALERLGINIHLFRTGPHKSAAEPLVQNEMSDEAREQLQTLINDIWTTIRANIIARRDISEAQLTEYTNNFDQLMLANGGDLAKIAVDYKLIDTLLPRDQIIAAIQTMAGENDEGDFYEHINFQPYVSLHWATQDNTAEPTVGLLVAKGAIVDGVQESGTIGGDSTAYLLKQARLNEDLDALVIRVDSPGGSAFASEIIRREVELFKEAGVPIFISMGSVAASGGYWISAPADEIWATPTTVTGSIGAFAAIPTFESSVEKLSLHVDGVETGPLAGEPNLFKPLKQNVETIFQANLDNLYGQFLDLVAEGRNMPLEQLEPIAGGRVWTGQQGLELGLVDNLGDLNDVIAAIAEHAELDDYKVKLLAPELTPEQQLIQWLTEQTSFKIESPWLSNILNFQAPELDQVQQRLELLSDPQNLYLHCGLCESIQ